MMECTASASKLEGHRRDVKGRGHRADHRRRLVAISHEDRRWIVRPAPERRVRLLEGLVERLDEMTEHVLRHLRHLHHAPRRLDHLDIGAIVLVAEVRTAPEVDALEGDRLGVVRADGVAVARRHLLDHLSPLGRREAGAVDDDRVATGLLDVLRHPAHLEPDPVEGVGQCRSPYLVLTRRRSRDCLGGQLPRVSHDTT